MENGGGVIQPVIMAGGTGTRLWPVSRETMPKQFIRLTKGGNSTFQSTLKRISGPQFMAPVIVTGHDFRFVVAEQMQEIGIRGEIVLEPVRRDSAAAVAVGALMAARLPAATTCLMLAADHVIDDDRAFVDDCNIAECTAHGGRIMMLGVVPSHASTAYGYVEPGLALGEEGAFAVRRFFEKPDAATAQTYVDTGLLWNSGNFLFQPGIMLAELETYAPQALSAARAALSGAERDLDFLRLDAEAFATAPSVSIDYAVMEKTNRAGVIRASFGWSDIGSWDAIYDVSQADSSGNVLDGQVSTLETRNSLVRSEGVLTAVVGLDDVVVVATADAVLVAAKSKASKVKDLVDQLVAEGRGEATEHLRIYRPWGWYQRIDIGERFQVKHICVKPGGTLSLQKHQHRAEHWVVVHGIAEVTVDGEVRVLHANEAAYLPVGCAHRLRNLGEIDLEVIEVQVGSYTGEDDIVRFDDIYART